MLLLFAGPFGLAGWLCGLIFINKTSKGGGVNKMNEAINYLKSRKIKLWLYPEGERRKKL